MSIGIDPSLSPPLAANRMAELRLILTQHDLERLADFDSRVDALPLGAEHLALARASAAYQDQRGWRGKAQARYRELLHLYRGDPHAQVRLQLDLAEMGMRWSDLPQMQRCLDQARANHIHRPNPELEAYLLRGEALLACLRGSLGDAKERMQQAMDRFTQLGGWSGIALGLNGMSYVCMSAKQWDEAISYTRRALQGDQDALSLHLRGDLLSNHGYALRRQRGNRVALPWVEDAYTLRIEQRDALMIARTGVNLAEIQRALGQLKQAQTVLQRGLDELRGIDMLDQAGPVANTLGVLRFTQGDYAGAAAAYQEALRCAETLSQTRLLGITATNLAEVYYQWGDFHAASAWYERTAEIYADQDELEKAVDAWLQAARLITWVDPREIHPLLTRALERVERRQPPNLETAQLAGQIREEISILSGSSVTRPELRIQPRPVRLENLPPLPASAQIATVDDDLARLVAELAMFSAAPWQMDRFAERLQAVMDAGKLASPPARDAAQARLAGLIEDPVPTAPQPPKIGGQQVGTDVDLPSYLGLVCGSLAEAGASPQVAAAPLMAAFARALTQALAFKSACEADLDDLLQQPAAHDLPARGANLAPQAERMPEDARAWNSLRNYCLAAIALLARDPDSRRQARADVELRERINRLVSDCPELALLDELLGAPDGEELLVIHPSLKRGFRVRISGITANNQLHTLLAYLLIGDPQGGWLPGVRPNRRIMAAERGTLVPWEDLIDQGIFNMVSWRSIQPDGTLSDDPATWIWGEGRPSDIPRFEGTSAILMGPLPYPYAWNAGPKFRGLQAECILEEILSQSEVERILERMAANAGSPGEGARGGSDGK